MSEKNFSIGTLLLKSIGAGYGALNIVGRNSNIEVLEFCPLGDKAQLVIRGSHQELSNYISILRTSEIDRSLVIDDLDEKVIRGYLSLDNANVENFVLIFESSFVGDLFVFAKKFFDRGLSIVDFRIQRTTGSPGYLIMTGKDSDAIKQDAQEIKRAGCQLTFVGNLSEGLKDFFNS
jgi:hypothetical protein